MALNVRLLLPKINLIRLELRDVKLDAIIFSETWLKPQVDSGLISLNGYKCLRADRTTLNAQGDIKSGGGLCIYYNDIYVGTEILEITNCDPDLESHGVLWKWNPLSKVVVLSIYRPPSGSVANAITKLYLNVKRFLGYIPMLISTLWEI